MTNGGNDHLIGGAGGDTMAGGSGGDIFLFNEEVATTSLKTSAADQINVLQKQPRDPTGTQR